MNDLISRDAAIEALKKAEDKAFNSFYDGLVKAHKIIADLPEAPDSRYAMERYDDLCEFGESDDFIDCILHNRKEFKEWLKRMHWHVMKCNDLSDELKKQRPTGHWIVRKDWNGYYGECSNCHKEQRAGKTKYCSYCGADMCEPDVNVTDVKDGKADG